MSKIEHPVASDAGQSHPGFEPWLVVCLLAFVPGALIVLLPRATLLPLLVPICATVAALVLTGLLMLARTEWTRRRADALAKTDARRAA